MRLIGVFFFITSTNVLLFPQQKHEISSYQGRTRKAEGSVYMLCGHLAPISTVALWLAAK